MQLCIEWGKPVRLKDQSGNGLIYNVDLDELPTDGGIYVFARKWGSSYEALYVGKAQNIRGRVKSHLNNLKLMKHLEEAKNGMRVVIPGVLQTKQGQKADKARGILERAFIRHFMLEGHDLVNQQGTRIRRHEIGSQGAPKAFVPQQMFLEKNGNE